MIFKENPSMKMSLMWAKIKNYTCFMNIHGKIWKKRIYFIKFVKKESLSKYKTPVVEISSNEKKEGVSNDDFESIVVS